MEPQFEMRFSCSYKMVVEFLRKYAVGPRPLTVTIAAVLFAYTVITSILRGAVPIHTSFVWIIGGLLLVTFFLPYLLAWSSLRNSRKQNDGVTPETVITAGDQIEMQEGMVHYTIAYHKIHRVVRLKHSYVLMLGKRNGLMLDPNGFTKGTFAQFKQFLREKRPDLIIPE